MMVDVLKIQFVWHKKVQQFGELPPDGTKETPTQEA